MRKISLSVLDALATIVSVLFSFKILIANDGIEAVGIWSLTFALVTTLKIANAASGPTMVRLVSKSGENESYSKAEVIDSSFLLILAIGVGLTGAFYLPYSLVIQASLDGLALATASALLPYIFLLIIISMIAETQTMSLDGVNRSDIRSIIRICGSIVFLGINALLIPYLSLWAILAASFAREFMNLIASRMCLKRLVSGLSVLPRTLNRNAIRQISTFGAASQFSALPIFLFEPTVKLLITHFSGLSTLGIYEIANRLSVFLRTIFQSGIQPLLPTFAEKFKISMYDRKSNQITSYVRNITVLIAALAIVAMLTAIFTIHWISPLFITKDTNRFVEAAVILLSASVSSITFMPLFLFAQVSGKVSHNLLGNWLLYTCSCCFLVSIALLFPNLNILYGIWFGFLLGSLVAGILNANWLHSVSSLKACIVGLILNALALIWLS